MGTRSIRIPDLGLGKMNNWVKELDLNSRIENALYLSCACVKDSRGSWACVHGRTIGLEIGEPRPAQRPNRPVGWSAANLVCFACPRVLERSRRAIQSAYPPGVGLRHGPASIRFVSEIDAQDSRVFTVSRPKHHMKLALRMYSSDPCQSPHGCGTLIGLSAWLRMAGTGSS